MHRKRSEEMKGDLERLYAVYAAFHERYRADRAAGLRHPVSHYRALFPDHADAIAEIHGRLRDSEDPVEVASSVDAAFERLGREPPREVAAAEEIARGGMGAILRVRDGLLSRDLAMKVVLGEEGRIDPAAAAAAGRTLAPSPSLRRFLLEARITAQLAHPGVVPVHALGVDGERRVYFTMKLVHGRTLTDILALVRAGKEGWTLTRAVQVFLRVGETVGFAHSRRVIHRDLKPANVMVGSHGEVYVMDWGLAKVLGPAGEPEPAGDGEGPVPAGDGGPALTMVGSVIGTPEYMPPEQAMGRIDTLDERSDVYSLGAMMYQLLAGVPPYDDTGSPMSAKEVVAAVVAGPPRPLSELSPSAPPELEAIVRKAMSRDPAGRYGSAADLVEDLHRFLDGRAVRAHRTGPVVELRKWIDRNRGVAASLSLLVLVAVAGSTASAVGQRAARIEIENERDAAVAARERAFRLRAEADAEARRADGLRLSAQSMTTGINDPTLSLLLAVEGAERFQGRDANTALYRALSGHREMKKLLGHDAYLEGACFDPSGTRVLTFDQEGHALLWDAAAGTILRSMDEHDGAIRAGSFSADGTRVLTGSDDGTARAWDAATGRTIAVMGGHAGPVRAAVFLPGGRRVATASEDGTARVFDAEDGRELARFAGHGMPVTSVDPSPDGTLLLTCGKDGFARAWRAGDGEEVLRVPVREGAGAPEPPDPALPADLAGPGDRAFWMLGGTRILACRALREVRTFDAGTGTMLERIGGDGLLHNLLGVSPERTHFAHAARGFKDQPNSLVEFRDMTGAREPVAMHPGWWPTWAALGPGGRRLLALPIGYDGFVLDRDLALEESILRGHSYWVRGGAFSPDGTRAVTASADMSARVWEVTNPDDLRVVWKEGGGPALQAVDVSPDGSAVLRELPPGPDGGIPVVVADARTGAEIERLAVGSAPLTAGAFDPAGRRVALSWGTRLRVQSLGGKEPATEATLPVHGALRFSPDGRRILFRVEHGRGRVLDVASGEILPHVFGDPDGHCLGSDWSPDGRLLATADGGAATATIWEVGTGKRVRTISGHSAWVIDAEFSPDGSRVATTAMDQSVQVWEVATGAGVASVLGLPKVEHRVVFQPGGGRLLAYSGWQARIADAGTGEILGMVDAPAGEVPGRVFERAWFSPDGGSVLAWTQSGRLLRLPLDPLPYARARLPRALDPQERQRYSVGSADSRAAFQREWTLARGRATDLLSHGLARLKADDLEGAFAAFRRAGEVRPRSPYGPYGLACGHARRARDLPEGSAERAAEVSLALDALEAAAARGWDRWHQVRNVPWLEPIRGEERYRRLVEGK